MYKTFCENCSHFTLKCFQPNSFGEVCFLEGSYENRQKKKSNFENFESALYSTSGSMPLIDFTFTYLAFLLLSLSFLSMQVAGGEGSGAVKKPKTAMTFFAPLTRLQPGRHTQVVPNTAEDTYILEIDAQSR